MRWLIKAATIVAPGNTLHQKKRDILIDQGKIIDIKARIVDDKASEISFPNLHVSAGWIDTRVNFRDPGLEYKEGLINGLDAAAAGGFTHVVTMPATEPVIDSKGQLEYLLRRADGHAVRVLPAAVVSKGSNGEQLAELYDLSKSGAVAFTDQETIERAELMKRALEYSKTFGGIICCLPYDQDLTGKGQMHEGVTSTMNGLKGIPAIAETVRVMRDLELLRYTGGRLHFMLISSATSVKLIREAKKEGLAVTCGVSASHLYYADTALDGFDSNLKVMPPFREENDRKVLLKAVKDGTIDVICSDHSPEDVEHKKLEFAQANFGIGAIENTFQAALAAGVDVDTYITRVTDGARNCMNLSMYSIESDSEADLTLFDPNAEVLIEKKELISLAYNNPFVGKVLKGRVFGIIRGDQSALK